MLLPSSSIGIELGAQYGRCNTAAVHNVSGWCTQGKEQVQAVATAVKQQDFRGVFFWSNVDDGLSKALYDEAAQVLGGGGVLDGNRL
jgi:hypothetical protein